MKKILTLTLILGGLYLGSFAQDAGTKVDQMPKASQADMASRADIITHPLLITQPLSRKELKQQLRLARRLARSSRKQEASTRVTRLRHNFSRQHSLMKRR